MIVMSNNDDQDTKKTLYKVVHEALDARPTPATPKELMGVTGLSESQIRAALVSLKRFGAAVITSDHRWRALPMPPRTRKPRVKKEASFNANDVVLQALSQGEASLSVIAERVATSLERPLDANEKARVSHALHVLVKRDRVARSGDRGRYTYARMAGLAPPLASEDAAQ